MFNNRKYNRSNQQLVAHCFFSKSGVDYQNYEQYYQQEEEEHLQETIDLWYNHI